MSSEKVKEPGISQLQFQSNTNSSALANQIPCHGPNCETEKAIHCTSVFKGTQMMHLTHFMKLP